jgi:predicted transcriptional regulator
METIAVLKLGTVKSMLKMILEDRCVSHHELATRICITSQGLTWQINRIRQSGLIVEYRNGLSVSYSINDCYVALLTRALSFV